jgi:hypothetical protein
LPWPVERLFHLRLRPLELLLGDQWLVLFGRLDPFVTAAAGDGTDALLVGAGVEPVPVQVARVDRVFEHCFDRRLGPLAGRVAPAVDVARRWRAARPVEVVGDLLVAGAGEEALEDLGDHGSLVGLDHQARLGVAGLGARRVGMRLVLQPVAIWAAAAVAAALAGVLRLPAPDFAPELLDLELVERLEHVADQPPLRAGLVPGRECVEDLNARAGHLALVGQRMEEVAREPRGRVDDDRIEATCIRLLGLAQQFGPTGSIIPPPRLLVSEVADDLPAQLGRFRGAGLPLRGEGERRVLLVLGREASVPGKAPHHRLLSSDLRGIGRYA